MPGLSIGMGFSPFNQRTKLIRLQPNLIMLMHKDIWSSNTILNIIGFNVKLIKRKAPENFPGLFY